MLLLFETAAGFALFKVLKENKVKDATVRNWKYGCFRSLFEVPELNAHDILHRTCTRTSPLSSLRRRYLLSLRRRTLWLLGAVSHIFCSLLQIVKLKAFSKFENTTEALQAATALVDSKLSKRKLVASHCCCLERQAHSLTQPRVISCTRSTEEVPEEECCWRGACSHRQEAGWYYSGEARNPLHLQVGAENTKKLVRAAL